MKCSSDLYQRLARAKIYIDQHFQQDIDLGMVSRQAFLSRFHFHRLFRTVYQRTPHQYITQKRLALAKTLLAGNKPVAEVCAAVGFESVSSFTSLFRKEIGFPPTYYRSMAWLKKQESLRQPRQFIPHCFLDQFQLDR